MAKSRKALPAAPPDTASGYVRLSRAASAENLSKDGMVRDVEAKAVALGARLIGPVHIDDGRSGAIRDRPEFVAWLDDARDLRASTLIAFHVDRMTREGINVAGPMLDVVEGKDPETGAIVRQPVRIVDTKGLDSAGDETSFRWQFVVKAEVARAERERMRDRARDRHARAKDAGRWTGGTVPYGFETAPHPDGAGKVLAPYEPEAQHVREAAGQVISGLGLGEVARWLNQHGTPPRRAEQWSRNTLRQLLLGEHVQGLILGPAERRAVREALAVKAPDARKGGRKPARLLSGLLICSGCGGTLRLSRLGGRSAYRCSAATEGRLCPRKVSVQADGAEAVVERLFLDSFGRMPLLARRVVVGGADEMAEAEDAKAAALAALSDAPTAEAFAALQSAQARLDELAALPTDVRVEFVPTGRTVGEQWAAGDVHDRRAMLLDYLEGIEVAPGVPGRTVDPARLTPIPHAGSEDYE